MSTNSHQPVFPVPAPGCESTLPSILFLGSLLSCSQLSQPSALSSPGSQLSWFFALSLLSTLISVLSLFLPRSPLFHYGRRSLSSYLSLLSAFFPFPLLFSSALLCPLPLLCFVSLPRHCLLTGRRRFQAGMKTSGVTCYVWCLGLMAKNSKRWWRGVWRQREARSVTVEWKCSAKGEVWVDRRDTWVSSLIIIFQLKRREGQLGFIRKKVSKNLSSLDTREKRSR